MRYNTHYTAGWTSFTNLTTPLYSTPFNDDDDDDKDDDKDCNDEHRHREVKMVVEIDYVTLRYDTIIMLLQVSPRQTSKKIQCNYNILYQFTLRYCYVPIGSRIKCIIFIS